MNVKTDIGLLDIYVNSGPVILIVLITKFEFSESGIQPSKSQSVQLFLDDNKVGIQTRTELGNKIVWL